MCFCKCVGIYANLYVYVCAANFYLFYLTGFSGILIENSHKIYIIFRYFRVIYMSMTSLHIHILSNYIQDDIDNSKLFPFL